MTEPLKNAPRNWGRWGAEDQIGCLNFLTNDQVLRGVRRQQVKIFHAWRAARVARGDPTHRLRS